MLRAPSLAVLAGVVACAWAAPARAVDVSGQGDRSADPVRLDVTETSIVEQHFDARGGESPLDQGYGDWLNRLDVRLSWRRFTVGARLDSSAYWARPVDGALPADLTTRALADENTRYRSALYPAKVWATYQAPGLEVTAGDAYVQFGRGLVLSMRKIDELGLDTTLRGAKLAWKSDPFALTVVGGLANPNRVDPATGRALFFPLGADPQPLFGSDPIVGAEVQAGRGLPVTFATRAVRPTRCAPYPYDARGDAVAGGAFDAPLGSCAERDTALWLSTLPGPIENASVVEIVGQGIDIPDIGGHGKVTLEGAVQKRDHDGLNNPQNLGNALYASASAHVGAVTETLEVKSYRNFFPLAGAVNVTQAPQFANVVYSTPPTTELITQDSELGNFNACVDGGRLRSDVRTSRALLVYATGEYFHTKSEQPAGGCDQLGHTVTAGTAPVDGTGDDVEDVLLGEEWIFDDARSHLFASSGVRNDTFSASGRAFYRELHAEYDFTKHIHGPYSIQIEGRHRVRFEAGQNDGTYWNEGENYTALDVAPRWGIAQGVEYTTFVGLPTMYFNGSLLYRITASDNVKLFVGQQRAGLKCISGVCKMFPAFEGARVELTVRF